MENDENKKVKEDGKGGLHTILAVIPGS